MDNNMMDTNNIKNTKSQSRFKIAAIIYLTLLIDNVLLTVIVPILPDYLATITNIKPNEIMPQSIAYKNFDLHYMPKMLTKHPIQTGKNLINTTGPMLNNSYMPSIELLESENGSIGLLLATKALVQLIFNPIVGSISSKFGYRLLILIGTICLLISSFVFAIAGSYGSLLFARALQGAGSALIGVCGMSLVAQLYTEEDKRSKVMGIVLGSIALGVLIGYPFGGILYDLVGKSAPFFSITIFILMILGLQILFMDFTINPELCVEVEKPKWKYLLKNKMIICITIGIWISTSTMAILEPCLPIWLLGHLHPKKWQLGTVFIPDSVGYFVGTNFFGGVSYRFGQIKVSCFSLILVGLSSLMIPSATSVYKLLLPHFGLGLGIGIVDAALVPMLASFVDVNTNEDESTASDTMSSYGTVYAIQQTSVSLAYSLGPLIGGELAETIGFAWLMRCIGILNLLYAPVLLKVYLNCISKNKNSQLLPRTNENNSNLDYKRLYNSVE